MRCGAQYSTVTAETTSPDPQLCRCEHRPVCKLAWCSQAAFQSAMVALLPAALRDAGSAPVGHNGNQHATRVPHPRAARLLADVQEPYVPSSSRPLTVPALS